ncbi:MAG TPA: NADH-quinone oxidoreductase subunit C [Candidatus Binatia bacterium]
MEAREIYNRLKRQFPEDVTTFDAEVMDPCIHVRASAVVAACTYLRDEPDMTFEVLSDLTAVDLPKDGKFQVVYHLYSYAHRHQIVVKADVPREAPRIQTMESVWKAANWMEREVFDLFGIDFRGHSDLRRIMLPEDWVGHPLRKDYVEQEEYDGISTQREALVPEVLR